MRFLLIDDLALNGWKSVIEKAIIKDIGVLDVALNIKDAFTQVNDTKYALIFLDARLTEDDHQNKKTEDLSGFKILQEIRKDFDSRNFSTPIILITASNKIWTVDLFKQYGVDSFYTKEHPNDTISKVASRKNLENLQISFSDLIGIGHKRDEILIKIKAINEKAKTTINNENIKIRIQEKFRIGYGLLFRSISKVEKENLLFNNEIIAFIVFWSILEDVSHDFYNRIKETEKEWILRKSKAKIQFFDGKMLKSKFPTIKEENNTVYDLEDPRHAHQVNLSNQISGILRYERGWDHRKIRTGFLDKLNKYRNDIDFIHSSTSSILKNSMKSNQNSVEGYTKCTQMLDFILNILDDNKTKNIT